MKVLNPEAFICTLNIPNKTVSKKKGTRSNGKNKQNKDLQLSGTGHQFTANSPLQ